MDRRTILLTFNIVIGLLSIFLVVDIFANIKFPDKLHYWLMGVYFGVVTMELILLFVSKVQQSSASDRRAKLSGESNTA